jgi:hypothetical protein
MQYAYPTSSFGYYRGNPQYGGDGSNQGVSMAGNGVFSAGQGPMGTSEGSWEPTVLYLFGLIILEMVVFGVLSRHI